MAVVSMMNFSGDSDELAAKLREHVRPVGMELAPKHGGLGTIVARTDDGVMVINLWENEEGRHCDGRGAGGSGSARVRRLPAARVQGLRGARDGRSCRRRSTG